MEASNSMKALSGYLFFFSGYFAFFALLIWAGRGPKPEIPRHNESKHLLVYSFENGWLKKKTKNTTAVCHLKSFWRNRTCPFTWPVDRFMRKKPKFHFHGLETINFYLAYQHPVEHICKRLGFNGVRFGEGFKAVLGLELRGRSAWNM